MEASPSSRRCSLCLLLLRYFGEAGCVATGFGFNGIVVHDGKITGYRWDRVSNCDVLAVESAPHMSDVTNNWNMGVNNWLKNYVYFRVEAPSWVKRMGIPQKTFMNLVTKATSAFWHGFYPTYYCFFLGAWLAGEMDDAMRASFEPATSPESKKLRAKGWWKGPTNLYEIASWTVCILILNFWGVTFVLLRADYAWEFGKNMWFLGVWFPIVIAVVCRTMFRRKRTKEAPTVAVAASKTPAHIVVPSGSPLPSPSPPPHIVNAVTISADTPLAPLPSHDVVHVAASSRPRRASRAAEPEVASPVEESVAKSRPRRSRSNKAE